MFRRVFATCLCFFPLFFFILFRPCAVVAGENAFPPLEKPLPLPALVVEGPHPAPKTLVETVRASLSGKKGVLLHLWTPSCPICREEMIRLDRETARLDKAGLALVTLAEDTDAKIIVPAFARRYGIRNMSFYYDSAMRALALLPLRGLPTTCLINTKEEIVAVHHGAIDWKRFMPEEIIR